MMLTGIALPDELMDWSLRLAVSSTLVAGLTLLLAVVFRRQSLPLRHALLVSGSGVLILLPLLLAVVQPAEATRVQLVLREQPDESTSSEAGKMSPKSEPPQHTEAAWEASAPQRVGNRDGRFSEERTAMPLAEVQNDAAAPSSAPPTRQRSGERQIAAGRPDVDIAPVTSRDASVESVRPAIVIDRVPQTAIVVLLLAWCAGSVCGLLKVLRGALLVRRIRRQAVPLTDERVRQLMSFAARETNLNRIPEIVSCRLVAVPLSAGLRRQLIILPSNFADGLPDSDLRAVLVHECAHSARRDHWTGLLLQVAAVVFWWNPLVHIINRQIRMLREHICDDFVARSSNDPQAYARLLVELAGRLVQTRLQSVGMALLPPRRSQLEQRIRSLIDEQRSRSVQTSVRSRVSVIIATVVLSGAGLAIGFELQASDSDNAETVSPELARIPSPDESEAEGTGDDGEPAGEELTTIEQKLETLDVLSARARKNMEQLRTWSAEGTLVMEGFWPKPDGGEPRRLRRHARFEFDIDFGKQRVYSGWHETQPVEVIGPGRKDRQLLSSNLFRQRCVLTPSRWLDLQAARFIDQPRPAVFSYNGSRLNVVVQEKSNPDRNHMRVFHMMIDPRDWFGTSMGSVRVPNNLFWDEVTWLKDYRQKAVKEGKKEPINRFLGVRRRDGRDGFFVTASRLFFQGNVPDAKVSEVREMDFSERASFLMTRCLYRTGEGRSKEESRITHSKVNGVFVPTKYRYTQFDNKGKPSRTLTVSLTKSRVNHEIGDERFTAARFDLKDGDRMRNREANAFYEWKDGAFEEIDPPKRPSSMEWNRLVSTDLRVRTHAGTEWNTLLRDWIEVWNVRDNPKRHADIARRYVALARNADDADLAFRSLEQVIKSEFAGPASVDAADMIVRDHLKHARLPAIIGDLQIGVPPSIASDRLLRGIIRESTNDNLKARACYELAKFLHRQSNRIRMLKALPARTEQIQAQYGDWYLKRLNGIEPGRIEAEAETVLKQVIDEFPNQITRDSKPLGPLAKSLLFHVRNLSIGRKALPIEGRDVDGNPMRLSDYPNRVRVLMFWGHWARRTHKVYPLYRELIEKNRSEPFEFLGISSDRNPDPLRPLVDDGTITWDFWLDGGNDGPIHSQWNAMWSMPHIVVLDQDGIIRFSGLRDDELDTAIASLLNR